MCWGAIIGAGAGAGGGMMQGAQDAGTMNANAAVLDVKAEDAYTRGGIAEDQMRSKARQFAGTQKAAMGESGLDMNSGTLGRIQTDTATMSELDAQTLRSNAMREAWGYETEADNLRAQAVAAGMMQRFLLPGVEDLGGKDGMINYKAIRGSWGPQAKGQLNYIKNGG